MIASMSVAGLACGPVDVGDEEPISDNFTSFEEFVSTLERDPNTGAFLVEGDILLHTDEQLREYYEQIEQSGALAVHRLNGRDAVWSAPRKLQITYCVSSASFGANYSAMVNALKTATYAWESAAFVNFVHLSAEDADCTNANSNVVFNVRQVSEGTNAATAFFPGYPRELRELLVHWGNANSAASVTLTGIMRHELGHVLGFRHEHTRVNGGCYESSSYRPLTSYDSDSVMHYRFCPGSSADGDLVLTDKDKAGAMEVYGYRLTALGYNTGTAFADSCPPGTVAVGMDVRTGDWVDKVGLICRELMLDGTLGATAHMPYHGGNGGTATTMQCPAGQALTGEALAINNQYVSMLGGICSKASRLLGDSPGVDSVLQPQGKSAGMSTSPCAVGMAITGIYGRSSEYVDGLGFVCSRVLPRVTFPVMSPSGIPIMIPAAQINGGAPWHEHLTPGQQFSFLAGYAILDPQCPSCSDQILVGIMPSDDSSPGSAQACLYNGIPGASIVTGTQTVTMTAPSTPGLYHVRFLGTHASACDLTPWSSQNAPTAAHNIGIINVY